MTLKMKIVAACAAAAMVVTMAAANAQMGGNAMTPSAGAPSMSAPTTPMASPSMNGGSMMPMGSSMMTSQSVQSTETSSPDAFSDVDTLPNTGGEPLLMMMAGTLLAGSAFAMRRRIN
jgi:LPXTG-motif cell wall-anchored protein